MKTSIRQLTHQILEEYDRAVESSSINPIPPELRAKLAKGGKHPATTKQKFKARQTIQQTKPWLSVKRENRARSNFVPFKTLNFRAQSPSGLVDRTQQAEQAIALFKSEVVRLGLAKSARSTLATRESFSFGQGKSGSSATATYGIWLRGWKTEDRAAIDLLWAKCCGGI